MEVAWSLRLVTGAAINRYRCPIASLSPSRASIPGFCYQVMEECVNWPTQKELPVTEFYG